MPSSNNQNETLEWFKSHASPMSIFLFACYVFNAIAVTADVSTTLIWLGFLPNFAVAMSIITTVVWVLIYCNSHNFAEDTLKPAQTLQDKFITFLSQNFDLRYLDDQPETNADNTIVYNIQDDHFVDIFSHATFYFFKQAFSEALYNAEPVAQWATIFENVKENVTNLNIENALSTSYVDEDDVSIETLKSQIKGRLGELITNLETKLTDKLNTQSGSQEGYGSIADAISALDKLSLEKRCELISTINTPNRPFDEPNTPSDLPQGQGNHLKILLKMEHTYTLRAQKQAMPHIINFSFANGFFNGCVMLAGSYLKFGLSYNLAFFFIAGTASSLILTRGKIQSVMRHILGHMIDFNSMDSNKKSQQNTSFIFKTAIFMSIVTASASAVFTHYALFKLTALATTPLTLFITLSMSYIVPVIIFIGASCLYFDSIFGILSNNHKDIYSPTDDFNNTMTNAYNACIKTRLTDLHILPLVSILLIGAQAILLNNLWLTLLTVLLPVAFSLTFSYEHLHLITWCIAITTALCLTFTSIHQIHLLFNLSVIPLWETVLPLGLFGALQASALSCLFFKNLNELLHFFMPEKLSLHQESRPTSPVVPASPSSPHRLKLNLSSNNLLTQPAHVAQNEDGSLPSPISADDHPTLLQRGE